MSGVVDRRKDQLSGQAQFRRVLVAVAVVQMQLLGQGANRIVGRSGCHAYHHVRVEDVGREEYPENVVDQQAGQQ